MYEKMTGLWRLVKLRQNLPKIGGLTLIKIRQSLTTLKGKLDLNRLCPFSNKGTTHNDNSHDDETNLNGTLSEIAIELVS